jgi:predicted phosphodiesterase
MIYITGDTHGDRKRLSRFNLRQLKEGDTLIICGDFGFMWNDTKQEREFLMNLGKRKYNICFIDGTHENFDLLNNYEISQWNGGKVHKIYGNLYHLMRGQIFEIEGQRIFTMGGGESSDIDIRKDVVTVIEMLDVVEYDLLHKVYVQYLTLDEASYKMGKSYTWATTTHKRALADVQKILDERTGFTQKYEKGVKQNERQCKIQLSK